MRLLRAPLALAVAAAACAAVCVLAPGGSWARAPFAVPLLLLLPGRALSLALFPRARDWVQSWTLAIGLSIAVSIIGGVELGAVGLLSTESWAALTGIATVACALVAQGRAGTRAPAPARRPRRRASVAAVACAVAAVLLVGAAIGLARTPLSVPDDRGYTLMSIAGDARGLGTATIRLESDEAHPRRYLLIADVPGRGTERRRITMDPGDVVEVPLARAASPVRGIITAQLMVERDGRLVPYRRVRLGLPIQRPPAPETDPTGVWG